MHTIEIVCINIQPPFLFFLENENMIMYNVEDLGFFHCIGLKCSMISYRKGGYNMKASLILEDGTVFQGTSIGSSRTCISEIVFNTSMTGYLEVLTDPSYAGQAVCMTYPLIGNYGICLEDMESNQPWPDGYIVRELSRLPNNFRSEGTIQNFLIQHDIPGISGIDTRALTRLLREKGTMNGMITTEDYQLEDVIHKLKEYSPSGVVKRVTCDRILHLEGEGSRVALYDFGTKADIAENLHKRGCDVTIYPASTPAEEVLAANPDGIMLSNGPGDPKENTEIIKEVRKLYESEVPIFAICLGHQLMALATGADTFKLKYGHRGGNHPVKDLMGNGRVYITSQNHGYAVDEMSLDPKVAVPAFQNVNDGTNEGLSYVGKNIFTVQFHPEACPGPQDANFLFDRFIQMMKGEKNA